MSRRERQPPRSPASSRLVVLTALLSVVAILASGAALGMALTRDSGSKGCGTVAWNAAPAKDALPSGWAIAADRLLVGILNTTLVGPTPSGSTQGPAVFVSVSCYGSDAQLAFTRDREGALAAGATNVSFPSLGDQTVAVRNSTAGTTIVYIRRGLLVADLTAPATLDQSTLEALAKTVDAAMTAALTSTPAPAPATGGTAVASEPPTLPPTASAVAESHVVPDLEARLPHAVKGTTLSVQSVNGTTALQNGATGQALTASLSRLGKTPTDLQIAAAHDPSGTLPLIVFAFRVGGVSTADLGKAVIESWSAGASPAPTNSQLTIGGRKVTKVAISQSPPDYMWEGDGVVFDIETTDESLVATVLALLK